MSNSSKWLLWAALTTMAAMMFTYKLTAEDADKRVFMPGPLSDGHHQLADRCDACHLDQFGGGEVLQQACVDCHGEDRVKPHDSHPAKKFKDPRNAELLESIDALQCVTCHSEHRPAITLKDGVTQPGDFCVYCHADVAEERPSHEGMGFDTCKTSGCHNFHNNRALYTNYLIKHLDEPSLLSTAILPEKEFASVLDEIYEYPRDSYPLEAITRETIDAGEQLAAFETHGSDIDTWLVSSHAQAGANCTACHIDNSDEQQMWRDHPQQQACAVCHGTEVERFMRGKHGMRLQQGLPGMVPDLARLPMKQDTASAKDAMTHQALGCNSCHAAHEDDVEYAAVEACLGCHGDEHSLQYKSSPHYSAWLDEVEGRAEPGTGVSCASCHMPRVNHDVSEWMSRTIVDHNQSANLSPNSKMIRTTCEHCHGLEFSIDALADQALIFNNFQGRPSVHVETMDLARKEDERRKQAASEDDDADMFGF